MQARYFYVVYLGDPALQIALDTIRLVANPSAKGLAHITLRGPCSEPPEYETTKLSIEGSEARVTKIGDFFEDGQNTVYLACDSRFFVDRWYKPDYGYQPHITLYDGPSRAFALKLRDLLQRRYAEISFPVTGLSLLRSVKGEKLDSLRRAFDVVGFHWVIGKQITLDDIPYLSDDTRLLIIESIWRSVLAQFGGPAAVRALQENSDAPLFEPWLSAQQEAVVEPRGRFNDLRNLVSEAYRQTSRGKSIDRILTDTEANADFMQECWRLGAVASQYELNRALLNARKGGYIGHLKGIERNILDRHSLREYLFASEVALRLVQDEEYHLRQRYVSLDRILCEPTLSYRFDQFARGIAPGRRSSEYRWAAIFIRKCQHRRTVATPKDGINFELLGPIKKIRLSNVSEDAGLYWLKIAREDVYIGNADNLRDELDRLLSVRLHELPVLHRSLVLETDSMRLSVAPCANTSVMRRDSAKVALVRENRPAMNVMVPRSGAATAVAL